MIFIDPIGTGKFIPVDSINKIIFDPFPNKLIIKTSHETFIIQNKQTIFQFICECNTLFSKRFVSTIDEKIWNHIFIELLKEIRL